MSLVKKRFKNPFYLFLSVLIVFLVLFLNLGFISDINNLFLDRLQGHNEPRSEIIVVGIDDYSLQEIGSWPWDRSVFATAFENIAKGKPSVIGIDVLFLESRSGDEAVIDTLNNIDVPIVFGSKLVDKEQFESIYKNLPNSLSGFVNFAPGPDGKIRKSSIFQKVKGECVNSFSFEIIKQYFRIKDTDSICEKEITFRNNKYSLDESNSLEFAYTKDSFQTIRFSDILDPNFDSRIFQDKIVIIGSTALDLRSNLNDNFTDIFGRTIPGVDIHANIINSFLGNNFFERIDTIYMNLIIVVLTLVFCLICIRLQKASFIFITFISAEILNLAMALVLMQFHIFWNFTQIFILLVLAYLFVILFRYFTQGKENQYIKRAFSKYLSPKLLNILLKNTDKLALGGETRKMSVLFSDIRSFTTISEGMSSEELINMLNDYLNYMTNIILEHNGTIDKYIGDAIMAFWNAPLDDKDHATNAVRTAIDMKKQLEVFVKNHPEYPQLKIGIGINTGDMTVGNVGGTNRFDYTVLGDNVNLGARLEGLTKKYGVTVMITESTMQKCNSSEIIFRQLDDVIVKGKTTSIKIYEPMESNEANKKIKQNYENGFKLYQQSRFEDAIKTFKENKDDPTSSIMIERCEEFINSNKKDFDGIWKWEEK